MIEDKHVMNVADETLSCYSTWYTLGASYELFVQSDGRCT